MHTERSDVSYKCRKFISPYTRQHLLSIRDNKNVGENNTVETPIIIIA